MVRKALTFVLFGVAVVGILLIGLFVIDNKCGFLGHSIGGECLLAGMGMALAGAFGASFVAEAWDL